VTAESATHTRRTMWRKAKSDLMMGVTVLATVITLIPRAKWEVMSQKLTSGERVGKEFTDMRGTPYVMQREVWLSSKRSPCTAPPFGTPTRTSYSRRCVRPRSRSI